MEFCTACGGLLTALKDGMLVCGCGSSQAPTKVRNRERVEQQKGIEVVDRQVSSLATYDHVCARCGYAKAEILTKGTIVTDEDEFFLWKCGKCGFTEQAEGLKVT